jgi:hypothetical protein
LNRQDGGCSGQALEQVRTLPLAVQRPYTLCVYRVAAVLTALALIAYLALTAAIWRSETHGDPLWTPIWSLWAQGVITIIAAVLLTVVWVTAAVVNATRAARELHSAPRFVKPS